MLIVLVLCSSQPSSAETIFERFARHVEDIFTGPLGRSLAIIAIVIAGIGAAFGRITMEQLLVIAAGISLILGAVQLVSMFA